LTLIKALRRRVNYGFDDLATLYRPDVESARTSGEAGMTAIDICGLLVQTRAERLSEVRERLSRIPGVEVHAATEDGRLVVTVEATDEHSTLDTITGLVDVPRVAATSLVYQYSDHQEREQESAS